MDCISTEYSKYGFTFSASCWKIQKMCLPIMHDVVGLRRMQTFQVLQQILLRQRGRPWSCSKAGTIIGPKYSSRSLPVHSLLRLRYSYKVPSLHRDAVTALH